MNNIVDSEIIFIHGDQITVDFLGQHIHKINKVELFFLFVPLKSTITTRLLYYLDIFFLCWKLGIHKFWDIQI
jgi:hypothetical protein